MLLAAPSLRTLSLIMVQMTLHQAGCTSGNKSKPVVAVLPTSLAAISSWGQVYVASTALRSLGWLYLVIHIHNTHLVISSPSRSTTGLATLIFSAAMAAADVESAGHQQAQGCTH